MSESIISREELEKIGNQGELLGLLKARTICDEQIARMIDMMNEPDRDRIDKSLLRTNINTIRGIVISIDAVMNNIHSKGV